MRNSGAFPKVAFSNAPKVSLVCSATCSVMKLSRSAQGMRAIPARRKQGASERSEKVEPRNATGPKRNNRFSFASRNNFREIVASSLRRFDDDVDVDVDVDVDDVDDITCRGNDDDDDDDDDCALLVLLVPPMLLVPSVVSSSPGTTSSMLLTMRF
jgi:hypothetical protein